METRVCKKCGKELPLDDFYITGGDGNYRIMICKSCKKKKDAVSKQLKKEGKKMCRECGPQLLENFVSHRDHVCRPCKLKKNLSIKKQKADQSVIQYKGPDIDKAYERALKNYRPESLSDKPLPISPSVGDLCEVSAPIKGSHRTFKGDVIYTNNDYFVVKKDNGIKESFLLKDIKLREIEVNIC